MSKGASSTESKTEVAQKQVGASQGSTAIGADSRVDVRTTTNIEQVSDDIAIASIEAVRDVSEEGFESFERVSGTALQVVGAGQRDALDFGSDIQSKSLDFVGDFQRDQLESLEAARKGNLNLAQRTSELLAAGQGVTSPVTFEKQQKTLLIGLGIVVLGAFFIIRKPRS